MLRELRFQRVNLHPAVIRPEIALLEANDIERLAPSLVPAPGFVLRDDPFRAQADHNAGMSTRVTLCARMKDGRQVSDRDTISNFELAHAACSSRLRISSILASSWSGVMWPFSRSIWAAASSQRA
jgi:hypothetical protein